MSPVADLKQQIDDLAALMQEFHLAEASLTVEGATVAFRRKSSKTVTTQVSSDAIVDAEDAFFAPVPMTAVIETPKGTPVSSPMTGIFYASPSPSASPFVKVGEVVQAGQVVGLIEAMKVFNEINAPVSGTVLEISAEPGAVVQPGDVLIRIG